MTDSEKQQQFQEFFDRYSKDIFRYLYFRLSSSEAAEDITSEVFIKFWKKLTDDITITNARALLYTIAHGLVIDEYRKKNHTTTVSIEMIDPSLFGREDSTEQNIDFQEEIQVLYQRLGRLKPEYQDVLLVYYIDEISVPEIARILKKKESTVRVLIHRALVALKKVYER